MKHILGDKVKKKVQDRVCTTGAGKSAWATG